MKLFKDEVKKQRSKLLHKYIIHQLMRIPYVARLPMAKIIENYSKPCSNYLNNNIPIQQVKNCSLQQEIRLKKIKTFK